ncbi:MAG: TetR/AcrR family transcriptional regulator [Dehalococcoidia bacterium]|nr:MAG: TetR/AcrR family transcriptional regulator [Dehalococcoidia bacterium]
MSDGTKRKEAKREALRRAALELFKIHGFKKVTMNDIAQRAGVSQVTVFNHFGSKDELVRDVMKWFTTDLVEKYIAMTKSDLPFLEKLAAIVVDKTKVISQFEGELVQEVLRDDPQLQAHIDDLYNNKLKPNIIRFFNEGAEQGYINRKYSADSIMFYFEVMRRGFASIPDITERMTKDPDLTNEIVDLMTYGLNG